MNYFNQILDDIIYASTKSENIGKSNLDLFDLFKVACEEIEKLKVEEFSPDKRFEFVIIRQKYRKFGRLSGYSHDQCTFFVELTKQLEDIFGFYGFRDSDLNPRTFPFILDPDLKKIIERDYRELNNILMPDAAWKSAIVLAGSILEAILFDVLVKPKFYTRAMSSAKVPTNKGVKIDVKNKDWKLVHLIEISVDIGLLPKERADSIDQIIREYRNFIHPRKEVRAQYECTEAEAFLAKGALDSICNHLEKVI
jgi:hypothetical protein